MPEQIVYVRCEPERAFERMKQRGGVERGRVGLDYLQMLHSLHETWFEPTTQSSFWATLDRPAPIVTTVDTTETAEWAMTVLADNLAQQLLLIPPSDQISHLDG